jgi:hypothetical protein
LEIKIRLLAVVVAKKMDVCHGAKILMLLVVLVHLVKQHVHATICAIVHVIFVLMDNVQLDNVLVEDVFQKMDVIPMNFNAIEIADQHLMMNIVVI